MSARRMLGTVLSTLPTITLTASITQIGSQAPATSPKPAPKPTTATAPMPVPTPAVAALPVPKSGTWLQVTIIDSRDVIPKFLIYAWRSTVRCQKTTTIWNRSMTIFVRRAEDKSGYFPHKEKAGAISHLLYVSDVSSSTVAVSFLSDRSGWGRGAFCWGSAL